MKESESELKSDASFPDDVARLIAQAGRRPMPRAETHAAVQAAVEREWAAQISRRRHRRTTAFRVAAALGALAIGLSWHEIHREAPSNPAAVGTFVAARGAVHFAPILGRGLIVAGNRLNAGTQIETGPTGFALLTVATVALRVGPGSVLTLQRPGHVALERGRIYADSGAPSAPAHSLVVDTAFGRVTHLGTQFQVRVDSAAMSVSVRDGKVLVSEARGQMQTITRGQGVEVFRGGAVTRVAVEPYGSQWNWVSDFAPNFSIDGRPLSAFLVWYARETGITLVLHSPVTQADLDRTTLSGSISGLSPAQSLAAVMATTRFEYDMNVPGELRIESRGTAGEGK